MDETRFVRGPGSGRHQLDGTEPAFPRGEDRTADGSKPGSRARGVHVDAVQADGHVELTVRGEIDIATVEPFRAVLAAALRHRCGIVVDLRETAFLGACAVDAIAGAGATLRDHSAGITLVIGNELQRRIFSLTGVDALVTIEVRVSD